MTVCFIHPPPQHDFLHQSFFSLLYSALRRLPGRTQPRGVWSADSSGPRGAVKAEEKPTAVGCFRCNYSARWHGGSEKSEGQSGGGAIRCHTWINGWAEGGRQWSMPRHREVKEGGKRLKVWQRGGRVHIYLGAAARWKQTSDLVSLFMEMAHTVLSFTAECWLMCLTYEHKYRSSECKLNLPSPV